MLSCRTANTKTKHEPTLAIKYEPMLQNDKIMPRKIKLVNLTYLSEELKEYSNTLVEVEVLKEYCTGLFHVKFPNGFRTDAKGENRGQIYAWKARSDRDLLEKAWIDVC